MKKYKVEMDGKEYLINNETFIVEYSEQIKRSHCVQYKHSLVKQGCVDWEIIDIEENKK